MKLTEIEALRAHARIWLLPGGEFRQLGMWPSSFRGQASGEYPS